MSDVVLINQYYSFRKDAPEIVPAAFPINLIYLASYLHRRGIACEILEAGAMDPSQFRELEGRFRCGMCDAEIKEMIAASKPKVVGIGCMFTRHYPETLALARMAKEVDPAIKVVFGGNHASTFPDQILGTGSVDYVVIGEGEETFLQLCRYVCAEKGKLQEIDGIAYHDEGGRITRNKPRSLMSDMDSLKIDYGLLDVRAYSEHLSQMTPFLIRRPALAIVTSRGCPNNCIYCTVRGVYGRSWRGKSAQMVVDEIALLHEKYGIREFSVLDDSASVNKQRWESICDLIIERGLDIRWSTPNGIAHWTLDEAILDKMKKAGCYRITFGIESGNAETRKFLGKPYPLEQAERMIRHANKIGMWTICTNIIGFPYESRESIEDTIRFAKTCGTDFAAFYLLVPHVSSDVYQYFKKEGLLDFEHLFEDTVDPQEYEKMIRVINDHGAATTNFSADELKQLQMAAYRSFMLHKMFAMLLNPLHIVRKVKSVEDFRYMMKLLGNGLRMLLGAFGAKTTRKLLYPKLAKE